MESGGLTRRGFMAVMGAGAVTVAGAPSPWIGQNANAANRGGSQRDARQLADAVLAAFEQHRVVAIGEIHGQQEHHDALQVMLADPRLPEVLDDIVVEFGNALYQPTMDRFVAGAAVENTDLRLVWRNTTQSPMSTWDAPVYEQFYRMVRAVNWPLPPEKQIRVLPGDPPIDWARVTTRDDVIAFLAERDDHMASVVRTEVLDKGRRALICYGSVHVAHAPAGDSGGGGVAQVEQETGQHVYVILAGGHPRLALYPRRTVIPCHGTWLESADAGKFGYMPSLFCGAPLGSLADAVLYLGQEKDQTQSLWNPAIYLDPEYWAELRRRNAIMGNHVDLAKQYRQEQSVRWPVPAGPRCPS